MSFTFKRAAVPAVLIALCSLAPGASADVSASYAQLGKGWGGGFGLFASDPAQVALPSSALRAALNPIVSTRSSPRYIRLTGKTEADRLKSLIAAAEAGSKGYDAVHYGARILPPNRPTHLTLRDILHWVHATPGQNHAIGRYQFIPKTLRALINRSGLPLDTRFDAKTQDLLADMLLQDAGYVGFTGGTLGREKFMNNLSRIWAGLPNSSGKSTYHGYAGNVATISWAQFDRHMTSIFE